MWVLTIPKGVFLLEQARAQAKLSPKAQTLPRQIYLFRNIGRDQIYLQGYMGGFLGQASRQLAYQSPSNPHPCPFPPLLISQQGVYVLQDNKFKPITRLSSWEGRPEAIRRSKLVRSPNVHSAISRRIVSSMLRCLQESLRGRS